MGEFTGNFVEKKITNDDRLSLKNVQNIYFKNVGSRTVMIGQFKLRAEQEKHIHTGNTTIDQISLDISFISGLGDKNELYVHYIKIPDCQCS